MCMVQAPHPTQGGSTITVSGVVVSNTNKTNVAEVWVGPTVCTIIKPLSSGTITCRVPAGAGADLPITISVGVQRAFSLPASVFYSYFSFFF